MLALLASTVLEEIYIRHTRIDDRQPNNLIRIPWL